MLEKNSVAYWPLEIGQALVLGLLHQLEDCLSQVGANLRRASMIYSPWKFQPFSTIYAQFPAISLDFQALFALDLTFKRWSSVEFAMI